MELEKYLNVDVIALESKFVKKGDAIKGLVGLLCAVNHLGSVEEISKTVFIREAEHSTGIGNGVAIPHARTNLVKNIFLAFGRSREGIKWGSMDGKPVYFIFLVVGPKKASEEEYLHVLADIARLMTRASVRSALLEVPSAAEVLRIIAQSKVRERKM